MYSEEDEIEEYYEEEEEIQLTRKRKKRTQDFSEKDKKKLATLVKEANHVWNFSNILHNNASALDKTWTEISRQMNKPKDVCKLAWIALRESYRYHTKVAKKAQMNGDQSDPLKQTKYKWDFAEDMAFLNNAKRPPRRIYPYIETDISEQNDNNNEDNVVNHYLEPNNQEHNEVNDYIELNEGEIEASNSPLPGMSEIGENFEDEPENFDAIEYKNGFSNKSPPLNAAHESIEAKVLLKQLNLLVKSQTDIMRYFRGNDTGNLNYRTQLIACDALLRQLPTKTAETTLVEIQNYILKKINDHQKRKHET